MDQLTAYRILGLEPGCTPEEIRAAYAALSKKFHPEEQPDEFRKIHDAYRLLTRGNRRRKVPDENSYDSDFHEVLLQTEERILEEQRQQSLDFEEVLQRAEEVLTEEPQRQTEDDRFEEVLRKEEESEPKETSQNRKEEYDFENVLRQNEQADLERVHKLCQKALIEMELLLSPQYRNNIKIYREFFAKTEYQEILRNSEFLAGLCQMLGTSSLKKEVYSYILDVYRLRGADPDSLKPEIAALYRVLERKGTMKNKQSKWGFAVPVGFLVAVRAGTKVVTRTARMTGGSGAFIVACILVAILCFFIWLYRKLTVKHSSIFAQFIIALCLTLSQFIMLGAEAYAPLIGVAGSDVVGFLLFAFGMIWLVVLFIAAVVQKIRKIAKK